VAEGIWERLGYRDELLDTAEPFLLWVIEGDPRYAEELPLHKSGLGVVWTRDMTQYRTRKVRILNGAHTMTVLAAYLSGLDTVGECVSDPVVGEYLRRGIFDEIIPTVDMDRKELESYAAAVLERFANPFIRHECISISLNSVSKFKARVLPSLEKSCELQGKPTPILAFSLAALAAFYRGSRVENGVLLAERAFAPAGTAAPAAYQVKDDLPVLERMLAIWKPAEGLPPDAAAAKVAAALLREEGFWGRDISGLEGLEPALGAALASILALGARDAMAALVAGGETR
jgi:tagaturonate reductase